MGSILKVTCTYCDWGDTHCVGLGNGSMFQNWTQFKGYLSSSQRKTLENLIGSGVKTGVFFHALLFNINNFNVLLYRAI